MKQDIMEQLYEVYRNSMYKVAYSILNNYQQAEDAVQDAFIKLVDYLPKIRDVDSYQTRNLILVTIRSVAIDKYRRNRREKELLNWDTFENECDFKSQNDMESVVEQEFLHSILKKLKPTQRQIIKLKCFYGLDYVEIAQRLKMKEATVRKRYSRARAVVEKILGGVMNEQTGSDNVFAGKAASVKGN